MFLVLFGTSSKILMSGLGIQHSCVGEVLGVEIIYVASWMQFSIVSSKQKIKIYAIKVSHLSRHLKSCTEHCSCVGNRKTP